MKSYIEPLNAADALDVLDLYGIDTPGAFFSSEHEGCVEVELSGHTALLETPESVAMLFGHDAATALCQHSNFRRDAAEIMSRALDLDDFLYNVYSGTAFIPDKAPDGEFFGFHVAHTPLSAILEDDIDPLSPDVCDYGLDPISETTEDAADGESVWMHPVLPGARYGKDDKVIYDPFDTLPGRSLKSSGGLPMVEFYLHRGDDRPDATRNVKDMEPAPYLIGRYYMKTLLADHLGRGILLQDMPRLALSADTVADVQDALAKAVRAYAAACDFEIDGADADIARCLAQGGGRAAGAKVSAVYVPVGDLPRETTVFPDMARAAASIGLEDPETETLAEYGGVTVSLVRAADAEGSELKPNRAWARGGATEIVRGGFLVIATDGDGEVVDLPKWAIESAKTRFADPSTGPFQASAEFMREVRRGLGEQIEQAGRTPSDIAALASQLAAKPGDDGGAGGKRI